MLGTWLASFACMCGAATADWLGAYKGTWSGTIGKHQIQVCLTQFSAEYYYLNKKLGIQLWTPESGAHELLEKTRDAKTYTWVTTATWKLERPAGDNLRGTWQNTAGKPTLPIALHRLSAGSDNGCDETYYAPVIASIVYKNGTIQFEGKPYVSIKTQNATAFEVPEGINNSKKINAFIALWIKQQTVSSFDCVANGGEGWDTELTPAFQNANWLVLRDLMPDTYCGGAHNSSSITHYTFDLNSGEQVDTKSWIKDWDKSWIILDQEQERTELRKLIERKVGNEQCGNYFSLSPPYPLAEGLAFYTEYSHAERACEDEIRVPYDEIKPYLTPEGLRALKPLMSTQHSKH